MPDIVKTMKLHIHPVNNDVLKFKELTERYCTACDFISQHVFDNGFVLNFMDLQKELYADVRSSFGLKAQMTISSFKTVTAKYKTVKEQLFQVPYKYKDSDGTWKYITRTLEWLWKPIGFRRPQADLVRGRDYSFVDNSTKLSLNTLQGRVKVSFDMPEYFTEYFDGTWCDVRTSRVSCKPRFHGQRSPKQAPSLYGAG